MGYLDGLNAGQLDAVRTTEGAVRVIAGAGTGKTRALTARYCYLTDLLGLSPDSVLCVTFTNKAAGEMRQRIRRLLGDVDLKYICTFHSWCASMLREDIHVLGYPENFALLDEEDRKTVLQKVYSDMGLTLKELPVSRAVEYIGSKKASDNYIAVIEARDNAAPQDSTSNLPPSQRLHEIYERYLYEQKKTFALDYDDLIVFARHILMCYPDILAKWHRRIQYVMVDEFQDVSGRQYDIACMLAAGHGNLFIVGDPDQTIYSWRGADVAHILDFDKKHANAVTVVLDENYRSTERILTPSEKLISHNRMRYPKKLIARIRGGVKPRMYHAKDERDEASNIVTCIERLISEGVSPAEIAVLYRSHYVSRPVEDQLMKSSVSYVIYSGTGFYSRREVKDVLAYMRMLYRDDDAAFVRTVNVPSRRIGNKTMDAVKEHAEACGVSYYEALKELVDKPVMARTQARAYIDAIEKCRAMAADTALGDLLQAVLVNSGYEQMLRELSEWERLDNLAELKRAIEEEGRDDDATLESFLDRAALAASADGKRDSADSVRLMTVHTAKGMEFDAVFVCGLSEGIFPSKRSSGPEDIEEERRLAYVAMTRARKYLFLSDSAGFGHDKVQKAPSRFIYEAGLENFDIVRPLPPQNESPLPMAGAGEGARYAVGDAVEHPLFGPGTISEVDYIGRNYVVLFNKAGLTRTLRFGAPLDPA